MSIPSTMLSPSPLSSLSRSPSMPYLQGIVTVSVAVTISFGAFKFFALWERVRRSEAANRRLTSEMRSTREQLANRDDELKQKETTLTYLMTENEKAREMLVASDAALRLQSGRTLEIEAERRKLGTELEALRQVHRDAQALLDIRTQELTGAQAFLTKADTLSGSDVIHMVETLNTEIMQVSAHMAESFCPLFTDCPSGDSHRTQSPESDEHSVVKSRGEYSVPFPRTESPEELMDADVQAKDAMAQALEVFGPTMVGLLQTTNHAEDPILLQFAFQTGLTAYTHWIISSWFFEDPEDEVLLSEVYARVREAEEQSVSGRWRALTRQHVQRMMRGRSSSPSPSPDIGELVVFMVDALVNVLLIAGLNRRRLSGSPVHTHTSLHEKVTESFAGQLHVVLSLARRLNKAVGEQVTSCDLETLYISPNVVFNPVTMEDTAGPQSPNATPKNTPEIVLCTTDLGLVRAEKVPLTRGEWNESVLMKPKVMLVSGVRDIIGA